jgi:transposase
VHDVVIVADKGFHSLKNLQELKEQGLQHVVPVPRNHECIDYAPFISGDYERPSKYFLYQKRVVWFHKYEHKGRKYVTFLDEKLRSEERQNFFHNREIDAQKTQQALSDENFEKEFSAQKHTFGTLTLTYELEKTIQNKRFTRFINNATKSR